MPIQFNSIPHLRLKVLSRLYKGLQEIQIVPLGILSVAARKAITKKWLKPDTDKTLLV